MFGFKINYYEFQPLEVVGRVSETQLQVGENFLIIYNLILYNISNEGVWSLNTNQ